MKVVAMLGAADSAVLRVARRLGEVTALSMSPDSAAFASVAATQRVRLWDPALAKLPAIGADREAVLATVLAAAARRLDAQLFVIAETSIGYLGSAVAEQLNLAHLSHVVDATVSADDPESPQLLVTRRCLHGLQRLRGPASAVLCVLPAPGGATRQAPAEAPGPDGALASGAEVSWSLADVGLSPAELPRPLLRALVPAQRTSFVPRRFDSVESLAARLRQDGLG